MVFTVRVQFGSSLVLFWVLVLVCLPFDVMTGVSNERPASFSACLLLCWPPSPPATIVDLLPVLCPKAQLYIYLECLWDPLFVPQAPVVCQSCVQQISAGVCLLNCLAAKDRGMYVCKCMCTAQ